MIIKQHICVHVLSVPLGSLNNWTPTIERSECVGIPNKGGNLLKNESYKVTRKRKAQALGRVISTAFAYYLKEYRERTHITEIDHNNIVEVQSHLYHLINNQEIAAAINSIPNFIKPYLENSFNDVKIITQKFMLPSLLEIDKLLKETMQH